MHCTYIFIHLHHLQIHKLFYHPRFSDKETEGCRVHTTSERGSWDLNSLLWTVALSVHKILLWVSTLWTTFKFQRYPLLPHFLSLLALSLKSPPCLQNSNLPFQCQLKWGLLWLSWAWPESFCFCLLSAQHTLVTVMCIGLPARLWTPQEQEVAKT